MWSVWSATATNKPGDVRVWYGQAVVGSISCLVRGSPTDQQQSANTLLMGNRGDNMNMKAEPMAVMGGSDAEVAQAQAQFRNQGLIGIGQM